MACLCSTFGICKVLILFGFRYSYRTPYGRPSWLYRIDLPQSLVCAGIGLVLLLIGALICLRLCAHTPPTTCDSGWAHLGGRCYKLLENKTFTEADHACRFEYGAQLASIHSKQESEYVAIFSADQMHDDHWGAWIGLHRPAGTDSAWQWLDGSALDYTNWSDDVEETRPENAASSQRWCVMIVNSFWRNHKDWIFRNCEKGGQSAVCMKEP
ncbi:FRAS1-related extracellular matrix protein 1-like protein [Aphelenchoides avenae]|nr:FRAS1-related extracellular matrix protein 1-like protein [Aphelenchus avenae]